MGVWGGILMVLSGVRVPGSATAGARMLVELLLKERTRYSSRKGSVSTCSCPGLFSCRLFFFFFFVRDTGLHPSYPIAGPFPSLTFSQFFCSSLEKLVKLVCGVPPSSWALGHCGVTLSKPTRWVRHHTAFAS